METITHEDITIKKGKTHWKCPFRCHDERYPKPKWKTEKAFQRHVEVCQMFPSKVRAKNEKEQLKVDLLKNRIRELEAQKNSFLKELGLELGETIYYVREVIIKPIHENRRGRMVKVRYEAVKKYYPISEPISFISFQEPKEDISFDYMKNLLILNKNVSWFALTTKDDVASKATNKTMSDTEHRRESSLYR